MLFRFIVRLLKSPLDLFFSIKWALAYIAIRLYNLFHIRRFNLYDVKAVGDPVKLGFVVPHLEKELESPMSESHLKEAADEVFFYGINSKSECFLARIARGSNQNAEAWIYLKLANGKSYHLNENIGYQQPYEGRCVKFSCGQLQMHYLSPMRKWRVHFCGMLKETSLDSEEQETVFVKFVFIWTASSNVYDLTLDSNIEGFADSMARANWKIPFLPPVLEFSKAMNFYAQSGVLMGNVCVNDGPDYELYLFGEKMRNTGNSANIVGCKFTNILGNLPETGLTFHVTNASTPNIFHNLPFGFVVKPDGQLKVVTDLDINIKPHKSERDNNSFKTQFTAGDNFKVSGEIVGDPIILYSGEAWSGFLEISFIEFQENGKNGKGLILSGEIYKAPKRISNLIEVISLPQSIPLTVTFKNKISHLLDISGGKGSSLGKLTKLSSEIKSFEVPTGIIVTTAAFKEFINREITNEIEDMVKIAYQNNGDLKAACKRVSNAIDRTLLPKQISQSILLELKDLYGDDLNKYKFAVRSSATGEDTEAMSSAGQMDTLLGVQGLKDIFHAVKKCWASQFNFNAVEYKRRYGQLINCPMAVVIQEMVNSDISGVLFTCDPVTCNPSFLTITANYGLGETVVSGMVEPDTITLKRKNNDAELFNMEIGEKRQRMIVQDSGGTLTEDISENSRKECCLSREQAERLGRLAIKIEKYFRTPRDIEWAIVNDRVYILQSRPITNVASETEFEIAHEFDSALRSEKEYLTIANTGEIMPGATSPLGMELAMKVFGLAFKKQAANSGDFDNIMNCNYYTSGTMSINQHLMMTVADMVARNGVDTPTAKGFMMGIFGRVLDDPELLNIARERSKAIPQLSTLKKIRFFKELLLFSSGVERSKKYLDNYHFKFMKCNTAAETFSALLDSCDDFSEIMLKHLESSGFSSTWNMFLFLVLCSSKKELDTDVYSDFATLLASSSDVESADIPHAMQKVASQISKDIGSERFKSMNVEEALKLLQSSSSLAGQKFQQFIKRHGHRCLKEMDVRSITWEMNPKSLVKILQNMVGLSADKEKKQINNEELFSKLNIPLSFSTRCALRFVLPQCRRGIRDREATKSVSVKAMDHWRKGFRRLAKQMVSEGRIPDPELVFFFTLDELKELLKTRSPSIISRANFRKKLHPKLDAYKFPEIMNGVPKPLNEDDSSETFEYISDLSMKGTPVSQGTTKGFARVALTLEEASSLKHGEILITYSTDICWSPYFSILSGVVTEIGGLISHGAVVSREYGLPCIVGLHEATKKFRTGDFVLLDGKKGILQRLPQPQEG